MTTGDCDCDAAACSIGRAQHSAVPAHGVLMLTTAFCAILCRFKLHQSLQQAAIVCLIASFVAAMTLFYHRNRTGSALHRMFTPHFGMGVALPAAVLLQAVLGSVRPDSNSGYRGLRRAAHYTLGYCVLAAGESKQCHVFVAGDD